MFITKKNYQKALDEQKAAITSEWERKFAEHEERRWRIENDDRYRDDACRRFDAIEKRLYRLEKNAGLVEEKMSCPFETKTACY